MRQSRLGELPVLLGRVPQEPRGGLAPAQHRLEPLGRRRVGDDRLGDRRRRIVEHELADLRRRHHERVAPSARPGTRTPAASTSTRRSTRAGWRSASSAPSQPPSDRPTTSTRSTLEGVQHVERVEDQVLHRLDRVEPLGGAEPRVHGEEDPAARGEKVVDRHPPEGAGAVEIEERPAGAALEELDPAAVDGERALAPARGDRFHHVSRSPGSDRDGPTIVSTESGSAEEARRPTRSREHAREDVEPDHRRFPLVVERGAYHITAPAAWPARRAAPASPPRPAPAILRPSRAGRSRPRAGGRPPVAGVSAPADADRSPEHRKVVTPCSFPPRSSAAIRSPTG